MANTTNTKIEVHNEWVEVVGADSVGAMSITGIGQYRINDSVPSDGVIGHRFTGDTVYFTTITGEAVYVRSERNAVVIITKD